MEGAYTDLQNRSGTRVVLLNVGSVLRANMFLGITEQDPIGRHISFTEVTYNQETGTIEMFKDGTSADTSYFFNGVVKGNLLHGQLANTLGRIIEFDLNLLQSFPKNNSQALPTSENELFGKYKSVSSEIKYELIIGKYGESLRGALKIPVPHSNQDYTEEDASISIAFRDVTFNTTTNLIQLSSLDAKGGGGDIELRAFLLNDGLEVSLISAKNGLLEAIQFLKI